MNASIKMQFLRREVSRLQPGQRIDICAAFLEECEPTGGIGAFLTEMHGTAADRVLETIPGSAYEYGYTRLWDRPVVRFWRRKQPLPSDSGDRTYVSPDRRNFYTHDGQLYHRNTVAP